MDDDERALLSRILLDAVQHMLASDGKSWEVEGNPMCHADHLDNLVVSIGLGNTRGLGGKLVIVARPEFFRSSYPPDITAGEISDEAVADWAAEIANQLLGRIKNRLSRYRVNFAMGLPAVIGGDRLQLLSQPRRNCLEHSVRIDGHQLYLLLEMERLGGTIFDGDDESVPSAAEGTGLLF